MIEHAFNRTGPMASPNHSLEATWDAPRFAYEGTNLMSWKASDGANPGASAQGRLPLPLDRDVNLS